MYMVLSLTKVLISSIFAISSITILENNINIGTIREGAKRVVIFKVKNNLKKDIRIYSISSTCGCTVADYPNQLKANKTTEVKATFDSKDIKGKVKKDLVLVVDDDIKYYKLSFIAFVD